MDPPINNQASTPRLPLPRITKACSACSRQKLRCDGSKPCTRCVNSGLGDDCQFLPSMRGKTRKRRKTMGKATEEPSPGSDMHPSDSIQNDAHRRMWERSNGLTALGASNSTLWTSTPVRGRSPASAAIPLEGSVPAQVLRRRSSTVDKLTSTLPLPGDSHNPLSVLVELSDSAQYLHDSSDVRSADTRDGHDEDQYYAPLERTLKEEAPHIMSLINPHEAKQLFETYFNHLHPHLPLLDPAQSSPGRIARRNNFLFNAICCAAARSYNVVLWERLKEFARFEMERLPKEKNMDVVQGQLIYTWWNLIPSKRFEQDMTWLRAGIATRTAIDIALHRVGLLPAARQGLPSDLLRSIVRTWLLCFVVDRTLSIQLGKPNNRQWEDEVWQYVGILRGTGQGTGEPSGDDIVVAALAEWALIVSRAADAFRYQGLRSVTSADSQGSNSGLSTVFAHQLQQWRVKVIGSWPLPKGASSTTMKDMERMIGLYERYSRLVVQSLALQHALTSTSPSLPSCFLEYQICAIELVEVIEQSGQSTRALRGVPDFVHAALTYAATSLLRCTQSRFAHLQSDRQVILSTARKAAALLAEAATGPDHIAAVQSAFLSRLVVSRDRPSGDTVPVSGSSANVALSPETGLNRPLQAIDFEAFARALDTDPSMTAWPPIGQIRDKPYKTDWNFPGSGYGDVSQTVDATILAAGQNDNLESWLSQQDWSVPGSGFGPGVGDFLGLSAENGDLSMLPETW